MEAHEENNWDQRTMHVLSFEYRHQVLSSKEQRLKLTEKMSTMKSLYSQLRGNLCHAHNFIAKW